MKTNHEWQPFNFAAKPFDVLIGKQKNWIGFVGRYAEHHKITKAKAARLIKQSKMNLSRKFRWPEFVFDGQGKTLEEWAKEQEMELEVEK